MITDGSKYIYVSISDVRYNPRVFDEVLYRTMAHDKDWRGGRNLYCHWNDVGEACRKLIDS